MAMAVFSYSTAKCASVVCPVRPLMGRMSWGQAENAITRSSSARRPTWLPGVEIGSAQDSRAVRRPGNVHEEVEGRRRRGNRDAELRQRGVQIVAAVVVMALDAEQRVALRVAGRP